MKIKIDGGYVEVSPDAIREAYAELDDDFYKGKLPEGFEEWLDQPIVGLLYDLDLLPEQLEEKTKPFLAMQVIATLKEKLAKPPSNEASNASAISPLLGEVLALKRWDCCFVDYEEIDMLENEMGEYLKRDEVLELIRKHFA